jgi:hypothetical protein
MSVHDFGRFRYVHTPSDDDSRPAACATGLMLPPTASLGSDRARAPG